MMRFKHNQILALAIGAFALFYLYVAFQIPTFALPRPVDSDLFPKVLGISMLVLAVLLFFEPSQGPSPGSGTAGKAEDASRRADAGTGVLSAAWWTRPQVQVAVTSAAILVYAFTMEFLGFVLASVVLCSGLTWYFGFRRHGLNVLASVGVVLTLYLTLTRAMGVYFPKGLLPF